MFDGETPPRLSKQERNFLYGNCFNKKITHKALTLLINLVIHKFIFVFRYLDWHANGKLCLFVIVFELGVVLFDFGKSLS